MSDKEQIANTNSPCLNSKRTSTPIDSTKQEETNRHEELYNDFAEVFHNVSAIRSMFHQYNLALLSYFVIFRVFFTKFMVNLIDSDKYSLLIFQNPVIFLKS